MPNTHLSQSTSRRDLAASLRGARPRKHARLRHRLLQAERLEDRQLLATISGAVFNDLNADGLKGASESGQSGWTIYLDADANGPGIVTERDILRAYAEERVTGDDPVGDYTTERAVFAAPSFCITSTV